RNGPAEPNSDRLREPASGERHWLPGSFMAKLVAHHWPGNVRELRNAALQIAVANRGEPRFKLPESLRRALYTPSIETNQSDVARRASERRAESLTDEELLNALRQHDFNRDTTAVSLGVSRSFLFTRINRSKLIKKPRDIDRLE